MWWSASEAVTASQAGNIDALEAPVEGGEALAEPPARDREHLLVLVHADDARETVSRRGTRREGARADAEVDYHRTAPADR